MEYQQRPSSGNLGAGGPAGFGPNHLNGTAARHFRDGDKIIIAAFVLTHEVVQPKMILVDRDNQFVGSLTDNAPAPAT